MKGTLLIAAILVMSLLLPSSAVAGLGLGGAGPGTAPLQVLEPPEPSVSITPQRVDAQAEPGQNVTVTFAGYLEVTQSRTMTSTTTVLVTVSRGWRGSASPSLFTRTGTFEDTFMISVEVPFDAEAHILAEMVVTASSLASGQEAVEASATGVVGLRQYYGVSISSRNANDEVRKEETAHFSCSVKNFGNGVTNVRLVSTYHDDTGVLLIPDVLTIGAWGASDISVEVYFGPDAPPGTYTVVITAEALDVMGGVASMDSVELTVEVLTWVRSTPVLWLTVIGAIVVISVAASVVMVMRWRSRKDDGGVGDTITPE